MSTKPQKFKQLDFSWKPLKLAPMTVYKNHQTDYERFINKCCQDPEKLGKFRTHKDIIDTILKSKSLYNLTKEKMETYIDKKKKRNEDHGRCHWCAWYYQSNNDFNKHRMFCP